jgi:hypothetical protein
MFRPFSPPHRRQTLVWVVLKHTHAAETPPEHAASSRRRSTPPRAAAGARRLEPPPEHAAGARSLPLAGTRCRASVARPPSHAPASVPLQLVVVLQVTSPASFLFLLPLSPMLESE